MEESKRDTEIARSTEQPTDIQKSLPVTALPVGDKQVLDTEGEEGLKNKEGLKCIVDATGIQACEKALEDSSEGRATQKESISDKQQKMEPPGESVSTFNEQETSQLEDRKFPAAPPNSLEDQLSVNVLPDEAAAETTVKKYVCVGPSSEHADIGPVIDRCGDREDVATNNSAPTNSAPLIDQVLMADLSTEKEFSPPRLSKLSKPANKFDAATMDPTAVSLEDAFDSYASLRKRKSKKREIQIKISSMATVKDERMSFGEIAPARRGSAHLVFRTELRPVCEVGSEFYGISGLADKFEVDMKDSLSFFEETHEEQDAAFKEFQLKRGLVEMQRKLREVENEDKKGQKEIAELIGAMAKDKQLSAERSFENYKAKYTDDESRDLQRLQAYYQQKTASSQNKINQGIKILQRRHQRNMQQAIQQHREQVQQRHLPEQMASAEWQSTSQQIQAKQQREMQDFSAKGEEIKAKTDTDCRREQEKIRKQYEQKRLNIEINRKKLFSKLYTQFQQLRQRYLKRHLQMVMQRRKNIENAYAVEHKTIDTGTKPLGNDSAYTPLELAKSTLQEKPEHQPPSPIKFSHRWTSHEKCYSAGGGARHKHRKGVMSQANRQISIEIHNEGIWISSLSKSCQPEEGAENASQDELLPWGTNAYSVLESIICGEVPHYLDTFDFGETATAQGGQLRCILTDLRTSDETASSQRSLAFREQEDANLANLEKQVTELLEKTSEAEKAVTRCSEEEKQCHTSLQTACKELEKAKRTQDDFRSKFRNFLGPDGNPIATANPNDRQELMKAMLRYKSNLENAMKNEKSAKQSLEDTRTRLQKLQLLMKAGYKNSGIATNALKKRKTVLAAARAGRSSRFSKHSEVADSERAAVRVSDILSALKRTAEKRRDQSNQKKSSSFSSAWIQSFPGLPSSLKKSLWHKMHRRKHQIVLRPTQESMINDLRKYVETKIGGEKANRSRIEQEALESKLLNAEQLFLLAMHPASDLEFPRAPSSKSNEEWAEPGWQMVLTVPSKKNSGILPCTPSFSLPEINTCEMLSAPGRQASSLFRTSQLKGLVAPMSAFAVASSPAETTASLANPVIWSSGDPFFATDEDTALGYAFHAKQAPTKPPLQSKKPSTAKDPSKFDTMKGLYSASQKSKTSGLKTVNPITGTKRSSVDSAKLDKFLPETTKTSSEATPHKRKTSDVSQSQSRKLGRKLDLISEGQTAVAAGNTATQYNQYMKQQIQQPQHSQPPIQQQQYSDPASQAIKRQQSLTKPHQSQPPQQVQTQQHHHQQQIRHPAQQQQLQGTPKANQYSSPQQRQLAQLQMMQQQQHHQQQQQSTPQQHHQQPTQHPHQAQSPLHQITQQPSVKASFSASQAMQPMQQFYAPLTRPTAPSGQHPQYQSPAPIQGRVMPNSNSFSGNIGPHDGQNPANGPP